MATGFTTSTVSAREKTNHIRLSTLLMDIGRRVFQDVFDSIHPPSSLHAFLNTPRVSNQLHVLRTRRILYPAQLTTLYPTRGIPESKNFDITLLFILLRNICSLTPPAATGWDREPLPTDLTIESDLVRIKRCRNKLYGHKVEMALTDEEFDKYWDEVEAALNRLGKSKYKKHIERLKYASIDQEKDLSMIVLMQAWDEEETATEKLQKTVKEEFQIVHEKLDVISQNIPAAIEERIKIAQNQNRQIDGDISEFKSCRVINVLEMKETSVVEQRVESYRYECIAGPRTADNWNELERPSKDVESYITNLKEAITKQTEMQTKGALHAQAVKTDDIFTNLVVHHGKLQSPEQSDEDQYTHKTLTEIKKCSEIFIDKDGGKNPKRILVSGKPGIGKTMFSQKLIRDLAANNIVIPKINFTYLITFRQLNELEDERISLGDLLNLCPFLNEAAMIDKTSILDYIIHTPEQLLVILDGFDEYTYRSKILYYSEMQFPNCAKTKMPVSVLVSKLIRQRILSDSVIIVTSRTGEANKLNQKINFHEFVQITGFSELQVIAYVQKYFSSRSEEIRNRALDKIQQTELYMTFGSVPFRCYLMCVFVEWEIKNNRSQSAPATLTEFYSQVIHCIERNYNREILSLDAKDVPLAVNEALENLAMLATYLFRQHRFSFTLEDLETFKFTERESSQITSSNLLYCYPVYSNLPFQKPAIEYSFAHFTIQEFLAAWYSVKIEVIPEDMIVATDVMYVFMSGLLGSNNANMMMKLLEFIYWRRSCVPLRCLYEFGPDKALTTRVLTANPGYTFWTIYGWIQLWHIVDEDCAAVQMLVDKSAVVPRLSRPHVLKIFYSLLTFTGIATLLSSLTRTTCNITELELVVCGLNDDCAKCLGLYLPRTKLNELNLHGNNITSMGATYIIDGCPSKLSVLHLSSNRIADAGVVYILNHCPRRLNKLYLFANPDVSVECRTRTTKEFRAKYPGLYLLI